MPSSAIRFHHYDRERAELTIGYVGGGDYVYLEVPPAEYAALKAAPSKGAFVNQVIKTRHPFRRKNDAERGRREKHSPRRT
jgi:hypothetical protein